MITIITIGAHLSPRWHFRPRWSHPVCRHHAKGLTNINSLQPHNNPPGWFIIKTRRRLRVKGAVNNYPGQQLYGRTVLSIQTCGRQLLTVEELKLTERSSLPKATGCKRLGRCPEPGSRASPYTSLLHLQIQGKAHPFVIKVLLN